MKRHRVPAIPEVIKKTKLAFSGLNFLTPKPRKMCVYIFMYILPCPDNAKMSSVMSTICKLSEHTGNKQYERKFGNTATEMYIW